MPKTSVKKTSKKSAKTAKAIKPKSKAASVSAPKPKAQVQAQAKYDSAATSPRSKAKGNPPFLNMLLFALPILGGFFFLIWFGALYGLGLFWFPIGALFGVGIGKMLMKDESDQFKKLYCQCARILVVSTFLLALITWIL
jgi:hypothetical protein